VHGVNDESWEPVPLAEYVAHLDYVKAKVDSGELWMETPSLIIKYRRARDLCGLPEADGDLLRFTGQLEACSGYATPLSVVVSTQEDPSTLVAWQGDTALAWRKLGPRRFSVDVHPLLGDAKLQGGIEP
jgi:hypothetical protein